MCFFFIFFVFFVFFVVHADLMALQFGQLSGGFHLKFFHLAVNNVSAFWIYRKYTKSVLGKKKREKHMATRAAISGILPFFRAYFHNFFIKIVILCDCLRHVRSHDQQRNTLQIYYSIRKRPLHTYARVDR